MRSQSCLHSFNMQHLGSLHRERVVMHAVVHEMMHAVLHEVMDACGFARGLLLHPLLKAAGNQVHAADIWEIGCKCPSHAPTSLANRAVYRIAPELASPQR